MISMTTAWDRPYRPLYGDHAAAYMLEFSPKDYGENLPIHVHILLDVSGSMQKNNKLKESIAACRLISEQLSEQDTLSLTTFCDFVETLFNRQFMHNENKEQVNKILEGITTQGVTRLDLCLENILDEFSQPAERPTFIVLISDGRPTDKRGKRILDFSSYLEQGRRIGQAGIQMIAIGLGQAQDYDPDFFNALAEQTQGPFRFSPRAEDLKGMIQEDLKSMQKTTIESIEVEFLFYEPSYKLLWFGRAFPDKQFLESYGPEDKYFLGTLAQGGTQTYVAYILTATDLSTQAGIHSIGRVHLNCRAGSRTWSEDREIELEFTDNPEHLRYVDSQVERWRIELEETDRTMKAVQAEQSGDQAAFDRHIKAAQKSREQLGKDMNDLDNYRKTRKDKDNESLARLLIRARESRRQE